MDTFYCHIIINSHNLAISALSDPFKDYNFSKSEYILEKPIKMIWLLWKSF